MNEYLECLRALQAVQTSHMREEALNTCVSCAEDAMKNRPLWEQVRFLSQALGAAPGITRTQAYLSWLLRPRMQRYLVGIAECPETLAWVKGQP